MSDFPARDRYRGEVAQRYDDDRSGAEKWQLEQRVMSRLIAELPGGASVLDVPLGTGRYLEYYARNQLRIIGLDVSHDMLRQAKRTGVALDALRGDVMAIPLRTSSVDYVVSTRLMNWLPAPAMATALAEMSRVSKRGVLLGIRESEPFTPRHFSPALSVVRKNPVGAAKRLVRSLRGTGITIHPAEVVQRAIATTGLTIKSVEVIDEDSAYMRRIFRYTPLRTYVLLHA